MCQINGIDWSLLFHCRFKESNLRSGYSSNPDSREESAVTAGWVSLSHTQTHSVFPQFAHPVSSFLWTPPPWQRHHRQRASVPVTRPREPCDHEHVATTTHPCAVLYSPALSVGDAVFSLTRHSEPENRQTYHSRTLTVSPSLPAGIPPCPNIYFYFLLSCERIQSRIVWLNGGNCGLSSSSIHNTPSPKPTI